MRLERGDDVSGTVIDEAGQPIAGAKVEFDDTRGNDSSLEENIQFGPDTIAVTDADGHWWCNMVPRDLERLNLVVSHFTHAETRATIRPGTAEATNLTLTMKVGFPIAGIVQDEQGNPIRGAKVSQVQLHSDGGTASKRTDDSGGFEFRHMKAGELVLSAQAEGFAPAAQTLTVTGILAGLRFQLGRGQVLRGMVTGEDGTPIIGAWVETTRGRRKIEWSARTDADGRFRWDSAPSEALLYSFQAEGFNRVYAIELQADGSEHEIKLTREQPGKDTIHVKGTVVDAQSGQQLDSFKVLRSDLDPEWAFPFQFATTGRDGKFDFSLPGRSSKPSYQIQIEKEGYVPAGSRTISRDEGSQELEFKLQKGSGPSGLVLLRSGEPAINAGVWLCTPMGGVFLDGPCHVQKGLSTTKYRAQTDSTGRFSLPAAVAPQGLIVIHENGYAENEFRGSEPPEEVMYLTLQPWGRVEGMLTLESKPGADERVIIHGARTRYSEIGRPFSFVGFRFETKTGSDGKFVFEKVPPGPCAVLRQTLSGRSRFESHNAAIVVNAGTTTEVALGGTGRAVSGRASLPSASSRIDWRTVALRLELKTGNEPGPRPHRADFQSTEAYIAAAQKFFAAASGQRRYGTFCDSTAGFHVPDVPAGRYELEIHVQDLKLDSTGPDPLMGTPPPELGSLTREIVVPETQEGHAAEPVDLGVLELVPADHNKTN